MGLSRATLLCAPALSPHLIHVAVAKVGGRTVHVARSTPEHSQSGERGVA
jgi:hypothetical protein